MAALRTHLVGAVYQWAVESGFSPFILVDAARPGVQVPPGRVEDGRITLNVDPRAVRNFAIQDEMLSFQARFGGQPFLVSLPIMAVLAIYARENGRGLSFEGEDEPEPPAPATPPTEGAAPRKAPALRRVK
ncbi:ClpXP protease specificity-enhancing factor [Acidiferrobacter sp. SPIII_3]|jgi:stringent starvation protein B|uniref:stringent starvation protein B n=1 Tax=Acidiferrobacter sp. SPIII_3 TaxID=1281578 RepID=UPI000D72947F|nr:ClpXP protease specificity-enhancing factor SspB [Acidiferrobacter sp. SPIII_3]AWP22477.1 ClpXP protease specificity-enhancing factor [Acidiferrobacter sp. SPIII_3]